MKSKLINRNIEVYDNSSEDLVMIIKLNRVKVEQLRLIVNYDENDKDILGVYEISKNNLPKLGIEIFDERFSFFLCASYQEC